MSTKSHHEYATVKKCDCVFSLARKVDRANWRYECSEFQTFGAATQTTCMSMSINNA